MKRFLVLIDFSINSERALDYAVQFVSKVEGVIDLLHVTEPMVEAYSHSDSPNPNHQEFLNTVVTRLEEKLVDVGNSIPDSLKGRCEVIVGDKFKVVEEVISKSTYSTVFVGRTGYNDWDRIWVGSMTQKLVRVCDIPLFIIGKETESPEFNKIVFATNSENDSENLLGLTKYIQRNFESEILLVRVSTPQDFYTNSEAIHDLKLFAAQHELSNASYHIYSEENEELGILKFALEQNADLIVLASHKRTVLESIFGSISEDVVLHSRIPVLTQNLDR